MSNINQQVNIAFLGTPELCVPYLDRLDEAGMKPSVVITAPDRPVGRSADITPPPVKVWATENNVEVLQPEALDNDVIHEYRKRHLDLAIVVAYGKILPAEMITIPKRDTLNVHYSLLPRWRGATPVEATILSGDKETGVTIQAMVPRLDAGDIVAAARIPLHGDETTPELKEVLGMIGSDLLIDTLPLWLNSAITPEPQDESAVTTCSRTSRADGEVSLDMDDEELWRRYRAYYGWPGIFFFTPEGKRIKIVEATFQDDTFTPTRVVPEGKTEMDYQDWLENNQ